MVLKKDGNRSRDFDLGSKNVGDNSSKRAKCGIFQLSHVFPTIIQTVKIMAPVFSKRYPN